MAGKAVVGGSFADPWGAIGGGNERAGAADAAQDQRNLGGQQYGEITQANRGLDTAEGSYANQQNTNRTNSQQAINTARQPYLDYLGRSSSAGGDIAGDARQSTSQYGRGSGVYNQLMQQGSADNKNAMSLADAMDPNNPIAQRYRAAQTQRTTDLGTQARAATQARPTTGVAGVNPALLASANKSRAGQAYAAAQRTMNDMRNQNFMYGVANSNNAYNNGQAALANSGNIANSYGQQNSLYGQEQGALRNEQINTAGSLTGELAQRSLGGAQNSVDYLNDVNQANINSGNRNLGALGQKYGTDASSYMGYAQGSAAGSGGLMGGVGTAVGGVAGGLANPKQNPPQQQAQPNKATSYMDYQNNGSGGATAYA